MRNLAIAATLAVAILIPERVAAEADVVNGSKANPAEFPWMAMLTRKDDEEAVCSGALVRANWVLTAGHCLDKIREGDQVHFPMQPPTAVKKAIPFGSEADVALIELEAGVAIREVPVGSAPQIGTTAMIIGFGEDEYGDTGALRKALVSIIPAAHCSGIKMTDAMLCVGDDKSVVCFGDSGGPLLAGGRLIGIANRINHTILCGPAPAGRLRVGAFARADFYTEWIDRTTGHGES